MPRRRPRVEIVAAFGWYANALQNAALEVYMKDPGIDGKVGEILNRALCEIKELGEGEVRGITGSCPSGWCPDANRCYPCSDPPIGPGPTLKPKRSRSRSR